MMQNVSRKKFVLILLGIIFGSLIVLGGAITALGLHLVSTRVTGDVTVDGSEFTINQCRSGQLLGFSGIQLSDASGRRLRVIQNPTDGVVSVSLFSANQDTGDNLGSCGTLRINLTSSYVNYVRNINGAAALNCEMGKHKVIGNVNFTNCH